MYIKQIQMGFKHARLPIRVTAPILSFSFTRENYLQQHSENQKTQSAEAKLSPTEHIFAGFIL